MQLSSVWHPWLTSVYKILPDSIACRLYLLTVLVETAIDLAIEADLLIRFHEVDKGREDVDTFSKKMPVYLTIFALAQYVQLVAA